MIAGLALLLIALTAPAAEAKGPANRQLAYPSGIATDSAGNVYVIASGNTNQIWKFTPNGALITMWGREGSRKGQFARGPSGIATDSAGNVYVTENTDQQEGRTGNRVHKFTSNGRFITRWGRRGPGNGQLAWPNDVATDPAGNVYVADTANGRIQKFTSNGAFITKWGSEGDGNGQFDRPIGIATDPAGNVYVADSDGLNPDIRNHRIQKFAPDGPFITKWGSRGSGNGEFDIPADVATDSAGNVYVTDYSNHRIQKFTSNGDFLTKWGRKGRGNGQFNFPSGIATDATGNVYVADTGNDRIQKFTSNGIFIAKWGQGPRSRPGRKRKPLVIPTTRRRAIFRAVCPQSRRCRARVRIAAGKKTLARGRYSIPPHSSRKVRIGLTKAGRRALARRRRVGAKLTIVDPRTHRREALRVILKRRG